MLLRYHDVSDEYRPETSKFYWTGLRIVAFAYAERKFGRRRTECFLSHTAMLRAGGFFQNLKEYVVGWNNGTILQIKSLMRKQSKRSFGKHIRKETVVIVYRIRGVTPMVRPRPSGWIIAAHKTTKINQDFLTSAFPYWNPNRVEGKAVECQEIYQLLRLQSHSFMNFFKRIALLRKSLLKTMTFQVRRFFSARMPPSQYLTSRNQQGKVKLNQAS